jgi:hypothetical protein
VWSPNFANRSKNRRQRSPSLRINCMALQAARSGEARSRVLFSAVIFALLSALFSYPVRSQTSEAKPVEWKSVSFAIVRFNDEAPASWNIYHTSKRGVLLVKLWRRYLLVNVPEHQVFDIDPRTVKPQGDGVQWSSSDMPEEPLEITEWKDRNVGPVERLRFRLGKDGHILELQIPLRADGKPAY